MRVVDGGQSGRSPANEHRPISVKAASDLPIAASTLTSGASVKAAKRIDFRHERAEIGVFPFLDAAMGNAQHDERVAGGVSPGADSSRSRAGQLPRNARIEIEKSLLGRRYGRPDCGLVDGHRRPLGRFGAISRVACFFQLQGKLLAARVQNLPARHDVHDIGTM